MATDLEMSFLPISEALQRLQAEGLLESRPRVGTRVRTPTQDEILGRYVVREALEAQSAMLCCERASFQERLELKRTAEHLDTMYQTLAYADKDSSLQYVVHKHHLDLHMKIAEFARCKELTAAIEQNHVLIYNWFYDVSIKRRQLPEQFHSKLIEVITGTDIEAAALAMRHHVRYGLEEMVAAYVPAVEADWRLKR
jgi:GntR family transcriptional regulator, rspAB operon transcriptional repressor